jgi:hypothetical protein
VVSAVRKRIEVPLLARDNSASPAGIRPPQPTTVSSVPSASARTSIPSRCNAPIITRVSSLSSAPCKYEVPPAKAAQISARLVILFDPGGRMVPTRGPHGRISSCSRVTW